MNALFKTTGPLDFDLDRAIYVERPERQDIFREIRKPFVERYVALLGSRQMGKTTLLYRVYREVRRVNDPVAFLDLSAYRIDSVSQSYAHAALKIWEELSGWLATAGKLRAMAGAVDGAIRFREFLLDLARQCRGTRIVILLDEVGSFISNMGFFETLRSISSSGVHDSEQAFRKYLFVFSGAVDLHDLTTGRNSPLANVCKPVYLNDFDLLGTEYLVSNLGQFAPLEPDLPDYIHSQTHGHPYLTQRICAQIEGEQMARKRALRRITLQDVDRALDHMLEEDENIRYVILQLERYAQARELLRQMMVNGLKVPFSIIDPRVARLFVIGAIRREKMVESVDGIQRERARCAVRNPIYERVFRQYFDQALPGNGVPHTIKSATPADLPEAVDPRNYLDFHIRVHPRPARSESYPLTVDSWSGAGNGTIKLDLQGQALVAIVRRLEGNQIQREDLIRLGSALWEAVFASPDIERRYVACQAEVGTTKGIRLKLNIEAPELMQMPWEYLYDPDAQTFPALSPRTPITRYTNPRQHEPPPLSFESPLRILLVSAQPGDQPQLDVNAERDQIVQAMDVLQTTGKVQIEALQHATVRSLQSMLRRPFHVLHYVGHGVYDERTGSSMLVMEDEDGDTHAISAAQLQYLLRDTTVRLTVLNACLTARGAAGRSIAGELMRAGLSATLAMQFAISESSATIFAGEFYRTLADGWPVDAAVAEGRKAVMFATDLHAMDWGVPALFMRTHDGVLFRRLR
ncbi:MAG: CHAT domain-containing protein [Anaerolineae bacterium]|nr:CHAT domain-containing protein [Anaerolineae bacterium]